MISEFFKNTYFFLVLTLFLSFISCGQNKTSKLEKLVQQKPITTSLKIESAAQQTQEYVSLLKNKNIAIVANQTSVIYKEANSYTHIIDSLLQLNISIKKVFSPEHGFRGKADASEKVADGVDVKTGLPIVSLYGKNKKPTSEQLKNIDIVVFDIQDVGVRFYTYISTLHCVMEACAENNIPVIVLDRPNPNGHYIDGPTLQIEHKSFVGMHPVPLVYGMTIGEYATMINGENWLKNNIKCELTVIPLKNYTHQSTYHLAIRPSPNLPNDKAINLYPSLGFFEGTTINAGRGTEFQFQQYGAPFFPKSDFSYTPKPNFGSKYPKHSTKICYGVDLKDVQKLNSIHIEWLIDAYTKTPKTEKFFGSTFTIHAGNTILEQQLKDGISAKEIKNSWQPEIEEFKKIRNKYLIYN
ncbi:exo-beta-N-acetylmuramidase NamZ domain-containing protein [Lutibacter holmesii]|uniref:Exo-beta-N-acetylmuramidase NamZ domain-containing protein n=1 Tax=Lutibacter holmesii TaxID=1137985 RepID=A0ABW3WM17_9FLAO